MEQNQFAASNGRFGLRFEPPATAMREFLNPYSPWVKAVIGCEREAAAILELDLPFEDAVIPGIFPGLQMPAKRQTNSDAMRQLVTRWELPADGGFRLQLNSARTHKGATWDASWKETPIGLWFRTLRHGAVWAHVPYVSYGAREGIYSDWQRWLIVNPSDRHAALELITVLRAREPRTMFVEGGDDVPLSEEDYDWGRIVLEPVAGAAVRTDFEAFLRRKDWFVANRLPYKRGYLLHGPPGNGKTTVVRTMICHPQVSAFSIDFGAPYVSNESLTRLFRRAASNAPAVIVLEDLDRSFYEEGEKDVQVSISHLLNCLDGLQSQAGIVVVATANDLRRLDPALLKRPGRFDRIVNFPNPAFAGRREYFGRFAAFLDGATLDHFAQFADGFSFAQLRESYILAGQLAFTRGEEIGACDLEEAISQVRAQFDRKGVRALPGALGFARA